MSATNTKKRYSLSRARARARTLVRSAERISALLALIANQRPDLPLPISAPLVSSWKVKQRREGHITRVVIALDVTTAHDLLLAISQACNDFHTGEHELRERNGNIESIVGTAADCSREGQMSIGRAPIV